MCFNVVQSLLEPKESLLFTQGWSQQKGGDLIQQLFTEHLLSVKCWQPNVASHCSGFSCCGAWALGAQVSVVVACGPSSCGSRAKLLRGMWDLPGPGLEPVSPALAGGFLTTTPPRKSESLAHFKVANFM